MIKVVRVEKLGDVCAFKPNEIQVVGNVYDKIPAEEKENFEAVVNNAKDAYDAKVAEAKAVGEKPKSAKFKAEVIAQFITPYLAKFGVDGKRTKDRTKVERVVTPKDPKITDAKDPVQINLTDVQKKSAEEFYDNNFSDEILDDSVDEVEEPKANGNVYIGEVSDDFDLDVDFDFEGL
jgi:hypothetical protein